MAGQSTAHSAEQSAGDPPAAGPPAGSDVAEARIAVGRINAAWGLRGHVKVTPLTSNPERLRAGATLFVRGEPRRVLEVVSPSGYPCIRFEGYADRAAAEQLRGALIEIEEADLPPLGEGEYYVHDLVGLEVVTTDGAPLGELVEVLHTGANRRLHRAAPGGCATCSCRRSPTSLSRSTCKPGGCGSTRCLG